MRQSQDADSTWATPDKAVATAWSPPATPSTEPFTRGGELTIHAVDAWTVEARVDAPWQIATGPLSTMYATVVRVELANGAVGWGECLVREAPSATQAIVRELLGPSVLRMNAGDVDGVWERMYATMRARGHTRGYFVEALSGVDIAIWDALGQASGQPVWRLLHGVGREEVRCYASSILIKEPDASAREAAALVELGYTAIKLKIGRGPARDAATVRAVREAIGGEVSLMVDANGVYGADEAIRLAPALLEAGVYWFEEPLPADDVNGYERLSRAQPALSVAVGEAEFTPQGFLPFLERRLIDFAQPDVARAGGITGCRRIAQLAHVYNVPYAPHTGASGTFCLAASLQLAAAVPNFRVYEHMFIEQPLQDLVPGLPPAQGGCVAVPSGPGLGLDVDERALRRAFRR